ncbi:MAG: hypothetical protein FJ206_04195 [Gemmatimonadetes bacterium]|nr:hypothetical protein [Gemmatimonadota bacterium]
MVTASSPIEAILPDARREGAVRLVADGRTLLSVPVEAVDQEGVVVGAVLSAAQMDRLITAADRAATYRTVLAMLGRRPYPRRELGRRLLLKGHAPDSVEAALAKAQAAGYLDDAKFAVQFVETRSARGLGPARLRRELVQLGVAPVEVEAALQAEAANGPDAVSRIEQLIAKRSKQLAGLAGPDLRRRVIAYLARRGFRGHETVRLVRQRLP